MSSLSADRQVKEAGVQSYRAKPAPDLIRGTEIAYKAESPGKGREKNKLVEFAPGFAIDLVDLIEQNRRHSSVMLRILRLSFEDLALLKRKPSAGRLGFCAQLKLREQSWRLHFSLAHAQHMCYILFASYLST